MSTSARNVGSLAEIASAAHERPVVTQITDLAARLLERKHGLQVIDGYDRFCALFESPDHIFSSDVVVRDVSADLNLDRSLTTYTPPVVDRVNYTGTVYRDSLNSIVREDWLSWKDVAETTLCQSTIAQRIVEKADRADVIALVIVDGLSYKDWVEAGYDATPVYVDCPTVTNCGYPNIVYGGPTGDHLATRLFRRDFSERIGFTYWEKGENELTDHLHPGYSPNDVIGDVKDFGEVVTYLKTNEWYQGPLYLQITLTGPERVAHKMKEDPAVEAEVNQIHHKLRALHETLQDEVPSFRIFATADHGVLWRMDVKDELTVVDGDWEHYDRRCIKNPSPGTSLDSEYGQREQWGGDTYLRLDYPYLFSSLRSNEPGTHGGFSFQECVVPLIEL